jgi:signal transduction histidine kinase
MVRQAATILLVDDNAVLLRSIERLLRMEGFQVLTAKDGIDALRQMEKNPPPDLIISDISMPSMDGFEFFQAVRQHFEWLDIPFLFLTARDQIDDLRRGYNLGVDDYIVKPLDNERLLLIIRSKLKRRTELMEHLNVQQHALDQAKRELAMMVAHELRTPLVSISMVAEILSREIDKMGPEQVQDMLDTMQSGSARLTRLSEQMVMFVQLQSGALEHSIRDHVRPSAVRDAVVGAIERARQFIHRQHEVPVEYEEEELGARIRGDLSSLEHALAELISNAVTFSPPDKPVTIAEWLDNGFVWLTISDKGPGIPEDELARVFEPYHQVNRQQYEQQGIGIGLPLAQGIIAAHDGVLEIRSVVGRGTQAIVGLPLWPPDGN